MATKQKIVQRSFLESKLASESLRITGPRHAVLEILEESDEHLSAEDIYLRLRRLKLDIGLTTVYRTLAVLVKLGLVRQSTFNDNRSRYELIASKHKSEHHHHLICVSCGRIFDMAEIPDEEAGFLKSLGKLALQKFGFKVKGHSADFYGFCKECSK